MHVQYYRIQKALGVTDASQPGPSSHAALPVSVAAPGKERNTDLSWVPGGPWRVGRDRSKDGCTSLPSARVIVSAFGVWYKRAPKSSCKKYRFAAFLRCLRTAAVLAYANIHPSIYLEARLGLPSPRPSYPTRHAREKIYPAGR